MNRLVVGYAGTCYGMVRVSHGLPLEPHGVSYRRVRRIPWHRLPGAPSFWENRYSFLPRPRVDALHFFNGICTTRLPWVSSIEMEYPRYFGKVSERARRRAFELMASDECRLLLPLSEAARSHVLARIEDGFRDRIERKTTVFTGGVAIPEAVLAVRQEKLTARESTFTIGFVGKSFWHKGGPAVIEAAEALRRKGADVRLLIVSEMRAHSHVAAPSAEEIERIHRRIEEADWIEHHRRLPNHEVLMRMAWCDVFAFPSFDESLGWVAIEALGLGLPVVASNIFAIPEIVEHGSEGLLVDLPLDQDRRWKGIADLTPPPRPSYEDTHRGIVEGCMGAFEKLLADADLRLRMGRAGRRKFEQRFSEEVAARRLSLLLEGALR